MSKPQILITGASGEIGYGLIHQLSERGTVDIVAMDLRELPASLSAKCSAVYQGDIRDSGLLDELTEKHQFQQVYHLAGMLSSSGEKKPMIAHEINVDGSINMMRLATRHARQLGKAVTFMFTSSIAVYGLQEGDEVERRLGERDYLSPTTMYGINKRYIEKLGDYFSKHVPPDQENAFPELDFRCLRFPGIISPETLPTGGTTDFAPEMLHAAVQGKPYTCFVKPETRLPFMVMPDGIQALLALAEAPAENLNQRVYNINSFSVTALEFKEMILRFIPQAQIDFVPVPHRQAIVDSWPRDVNDDAARRDWQWSPQYGFESAFSDLLVPRVRKHYGL